MREEDSNWFARWEQELPSPEELMPLSQSLITPDLALAFDIRIPNHFGSGISGQIQRPQQTPPPPPPPPPSSQGNSSAEFGADSVDLGLGGSGGDEPARTLKRPRLVWTPQLHKRFVDAVAHLGIKNAVPKTIMQLMSVDGLTRENVASHLQKYRLYLRRMQGLSGGSGGNGGGGAGSDPATDHLFASSPVPAHFLHQTRGSLGSDHFIPSFVPMTTLQQQQQQMAAVAAATAAAAAANQQHFQPPQFHHRQLTQLGSPTNGQFHLPTNTQFGSQFRSPVNGQIEHSFLARQTQPHQSHPPASYIEDFGSANSDSGRKVLTLFPTRDE